MKPKPVKRSTPKPHQHCGGCELVIVTLIVVAGVLAGTVGLAAVQQWAVHSKDVTEMAALPDAVKPVERHPFNRKHCHEISAETLNRAERLRIEQNHVADSEAR